MVIGKFIMLGRQFRYWPPSQRGAVRALPSGRKSAFVHLKRGDVDGTRWEAVFSIATRAGSSRLVTFDREEFSEFRKILARLRSVGLLWRAKNEISDSSALPDLQP